MEHKLLSVNKRVLEDELKYNDTVILIYKIEYPEFKADTYRLCLSVANMFYESKAKEFQSYIETILFDMAVEQYKADIENGYPVRVFDARLVYEITYSSACIISLFLDRYEYTGGAHGSTVRASQTWNLQKCARLGLKQLVKCPGGYKNYILERVEEQIELNPEIYFENYKELISENFNENSFYCTPRGIVVYYQQYDIAPYASGIRSFLIPYSDCVLNPKKTCFIM